MKRGTVDVDAPHHASHCHYRGSCCSEQSLGRTSSSTNRATTLATAAPTAVLFVGRSPGSSRTVANMRQRGGGGVAGQWVPGGNAPTELQEYTAHVPDLVLRLVPLWVRGGVRTLGARGCAGAVRFYVHAVLKYPVDCVFAHAVGGEADHDSMDKTSKCIAHAHKFTTDGLDESTTISVHYVGAC